MNGVLSHLEVPDVRPDRPESPADLRNNRAISNTDTNWTRRSLPPAPPGRSPKVPGKMRAPDPEGVESTGNPAMSGLRGPTLSSGKSPNLAS